MRKPSGRRPLPIGSIKTNLGHLETAAGIAGLVKAALVLKHGQIPASLHFEKPNPHIDFAALKLRVPVAMEAFPKTNALRMAGVNSFGFGGSNSHVILTEPPPRSSPTTVASNTLRAWPLILSARSEGALRASASRLKEWLETKEKSNGSTPVLPDLVYTLGCQTQSPPTSAYLGGALFGRRHSGTRRLYPKPRRLEGPE